MLSVNLEEGKLLLNGDIKPMIASKRPYGKMVENMVSELDAKPFQKGAIATIYVIVLFHMIYDCVLFRYIHVHRKLPS